MNATQNKPKGKKSLLTILALGALAFAQWKGWLPTGGSADGGGGATTAERPVDRTPSFPSNPATSNSKSEPFGSPTKGSSAPAFEPQAEETTQASKPAAPAQASKPSKAQREAEEDDKGRKRLAQAFRYGQSDLIVTSSGKVRALLPDDNEGSRHQKFILELTKDHTILVSHNIDLAPRVPIERGDKVRFKGEYEYTKKGGVIHWTHHNPHGAAGRHEGGWLEVDGKRYE